MIGYEIIYIVFWGGLTLTILIIVDRRFKLIDKFMKKISFK